MIKGLAVFVALAMILLPIPQTREAQANEKPIVIKGYSGKLEVAITQQQRGSLAFDLVMEVQANQTTDLNSFFLSQDKFDCTLVEVDGKIANHTFKGQDFWLNFPKTLEKGTHKVRVVYKYLIYELEPEKIAMNLFADKNHFHCFGGWFPIIKGYIFDEPVNFNVEVMIPSEWHLMGNWVPEQYRERPKADGKYRLSRSYQNPYEVKLVGGSYDATKGGDENVKVWIYTFKKQANDAQYIAYWGKIVNDYYTDLLKNPGKGDVSITALVGYHNGIQTFDGGYAVDAPYLNRLNFSPVFLAREMAKGWWGGLVTSDRQPEKRFFEESMPDFMTLRFLEGHMLPQDFSNYHKSVLETFWKSHFPGETPLVDPKSAGNDFLIYSKAPLVVNALRGYMGDRSFDQALEAFIDRYNFIEYPKEPRPTFEHFKAQMEASHGGSIDPFWSVFFETGKVPIPALDVEKSDANGGPVKEKIHMRNLEETGYKISYSFFKVDGSKDSFVFDGEEAEKEISGGLAGIVNESFKSIIPKPGNLGYSMGSGTIASTLAWTKPTIYCFNSEMMERAQQWASLTGEKVVTLKSDVLPTTPVILVGPEAISFFGLRTMALLPMKATNAQLVWRQDEVAGEFGYILQFPSNENFQLPMIADNGIGKLPKDLSWSGIFEEKNSKMVLGFRNTLIDEFSPPKLEYVHTAWTSDSQVTPDCRIDLGLQDAIGYKVIYDGFDPDKFEFGRIERKITRQISSQTIYLDLSKAASVSLEKADRYLLQRSQQTYTYSGKSVNYKGPANLKVPQAVPGTTADAAWGENVKFMYRLDGIGTSNWETGTNVVLGNLSPDRHKFRIIFYNDGILSPIREYEIVSGAKPPVLSLESRQVQCRDGRIVIKGTTDRDVTLDPPGKINQDGSFEIVMEIQDCPKTVTVKARNRFNLESVETVTVSTGKQVKLTMRLGSNQATDESGKTYKLSVPPQKIKGMTYVPMRFIGERLGATILWDSNLKKVTYILGSTKVEIIIGKSEAIVNGKTTRMPGPPEVVSGNTLVPVRFVAEALGARVTWVGETQTIIVEYP